MKRLSAVTTVALLIVASSCGGGGGDSKGSAGPATNGQPDVITSSEAGKTFVGKCQPMTLMGQALFAKSSYAFTSESGRSDGLPPYSEIVEIYTDSRCSEYAQTVRTVGDYTISPDGTLANLTFNGMLIMVEDQGLADKMNQISYCGITDWAVGDRRELSVEGNCWPSVKSATYLIQVQDQTAGKFTIYNCPTATAVPNASCTGLQMTEAK